MIRKKVLIPIVLTTVLGGAVYGTKIQAINTNPFTDLAQIISQIPVNDQNKDQETIILDNDIKNVEDTNYL